jgi:hypothetical protein
VESRDFEIILKHELSGATLARRVQ